MPARFTADQVNRYVMQKQQLAGSRESDVTKVAKAIGPIRAAPPVTPYLSLWARIEDLDKSRLDDALYRERTLVRIPCMHARLYLVPVDDLAVYRRLGQDLLQPGLRDVLDLYSRESPIDQNGDRLSVEELTRRVLEVLCARGPATIDELTQFLPELKIRLYHDPDHPELGHSRLGTRLLPALCAQGILVRAQPRGGWRSDFYSYSALSSWLPDARVDGLTSGDALQRAVRSYLAAFGPATLSDVYHWLGGYARSDVAAALMSLGRDLVRIQIAGHPHEHLILREELDALAEIDEPEPTLRLLPPRDSYSMAYESSWRILPEIHRERVFDRVGESAGTVWLDGVIVGTWGVQMREERITVRFFEPPPPETLAMAGEEARAMGEFLEFDETDIDIGIQEDEDQDGEEEALIAKLNINVEPWSVVEK
jgi:hypothetical protein